METLETTAVIFSATSSTVAATETIPVIDYIVEKNPETGRIEERSIRYVPGERSIYVDDQSETAGKRPSEIILRYGTLMVSNYEVTLLEYLRKCNYNLTNPNRKQTSNPILRENKPGEESEKFLSDDKLITDIKHKIYNMSASELEAVAYYIGMKGASQELSNDLKRDLVLMATKKQSLFLNAINDMRTTRVYHVIHLGLENGVIKFINNTVQDQVGKDIFSCRSNKDLIDEFANWLTRGKGSGFYSNLLKEVDPHNEYNKTKVSGIEFLEKEEDEPTKEDDSLIDFTALTPKELFDLAIEKKIFDKEGRAITFREQEDRKYNFLAKNMKDAISLISSDKTFREKIIDLIQYS